MPERYAREVLTALSSRATATCGWFCTRRAFTRRRNPTGISKCSDITGIHVRSNAAETSARMTSAAFFVPKTDTCGAKTCTKTCILLVFTCTTCTAHISWCKILAGEFAAHYLCTVKQDKRSVTCWKTFNIYFYTNDHQWAHIMVMNINGHYMELIHGHYM